VYASQISCSPAATLFLGALNRRKFLKYAGATGAVVGASALGLNYLLKPMITRLTYELSKVVNSKIYDIRVDVEISNPAKRLLSVQVALEPVVYTYLPSEAFTNEQSKATMLQTTGLENELLSAYFTNLKGGREYDVKASTNDGSAMVDTRTLRTEYVREFENIAALDDMTVIADYYTWYMIPPNSWYDNGRSVHVYWPLLGEYDSADPIVISKHIDWATGYGIDAFAISWCGDTNTNPNNPGANPSDLTSFEDAFLKHPMLNQMKFFILYENNDRIRIENPNEPSEKWIEDLNDPFNRERLVSDFLYLAKYFSNPSYLKVGGKPAVIFDYAASFRGDIKDTFNEVRDKVRENSGYELYLVNDLGMRAFDPQEIVNDGHPHILELVESTDAIGYGVDLGPQAEECYAAWHNIAIEHEKDYLPYSQPGLEAPQWTMDAIPALPRVPRNPKLFRTLIHLSKKYSTHKMIGIKAFNDWDWGQAIEPAKEYGFEYLEIVKSSLMN